eukprot:SAG31_NODE_1011_length_10382_cov_8.910240_11_plen_603_part_00
MFADELTHSSNMAVKLCLDVEAFESGTSRNETADLRLVRRLLFPQEASKSFVTLWGSPLHAVTLPSNVRVTASIPVTAAYYNFCYPAWLSEDAKLKRKCRAPLRYLLELFAEHFDVMNSDSSASEEWLEPWFEALRVGRAEHIVIDHLVDNTVIDARDTAEQQSNAVRGETSPQMERRLAFVLKRILSERGALVSKLEAYNLSHLVRVATNLAVFEKDICRVLNVLPNELRKLVGTDTAETYCVAHMTDSVTAELKRDILELIENELELLHSILLLDVGDIAAEDSLPSRICKSDPFVKWLTTGAFVYYDHKYDVVAINALSFDEVQDTNIAQLKFQGCDPTEMLSLHSEAAKRQRLPDVSVDPLETSGRWWPITISHFKLEGFTHFAWIKPSEFLGGYIFTKSGGFAYKHEDKYNKSIYYAVGVSSSRLPTWPMKYNAPLCVDGLTTHVDPMQGHHLTEHKFNFELCVKIAPTAMILRCVETLLFNHCRMKFAAGEMSAHGLSSILGEIMWPGGDDRDTLDIFIREVEMAVKWCHALAIEKADEGITLLCTARLHDGAELSTCGSCTKDRLMTAGERRQKLGFVSSCYHSMTYLLAGWICK